MTLPKTLTCFKTYDVRGKVGVELNEDIAFRIGRATVQSLAAGSVVVGFDARKTSVKLEKALTEGICIAGANVLKIGLAGTEEMYNAVSHFNADAGIEVTASHNPIDYNGFKIVKSGSKPLSAKEFAEIKHLSEENIFLTFQNKGFVSDVKLTAREAYLAKLLNFIDVKKLKPLKVIINSGNGAAGPVIDALSKVLVAKGVSTDFVLVHHQPNSSFPNGIPNPLLEENRLATVNALKREKADFGVAFDGDFDRCFFFDEFGNFIAGEYVVGTLAQIFLNKEKGATIIHDPRVIWNIIDIVKTNCGKAVASNTGHAFVKQAMRTENAVYGGEMSAHHYFRDFYYCDSGMIPWLMIWEFLSMQDVCLSEIISKRKMLFPSSGEINFIVSNPDDCIGRLKDFYAHNSIEICEDDGLSMVFEKWRFNLRKSNTEPLIRLNIETLGDQGLLRKKRTELNSLLASE